MATPIFFFAIIVVLCQFLRIEVAAARHKALPSPVRANAFRRSPAAFLPRAQKTGLSWKDRSPSIALSRPLAWFLLPTLYVWFNRSEKKQAKPEA
jgi:hypothetical protein